MTRLSPAGSGSKLLTRMHGYKKQVRGHATSRPLRRSVIKVQGGSPGSGGLPATFPIDFQLHEEGHQQGV